MRQADKKKTSPAGEHYRSVQRQLSPGARAPPPANDSGLDFTGVKLVQETARNQPVVNRMPIILPSAEQLKQATLESERSSC